MNDLNNDVITIDDVRKRLAPDFYGTFSALLTLVEIQEMKQRAKLAKEESQTSSVITSSAATVKSKRAADDQRTSISNKRMRPPKTVPSPPPEPKTPDRPTHPSNPDFTGASTLSTTSKDEENTKELLSQLVLNTLGVLEMDFRQITWQRNGYKVELSQT
jgi:hypothetical protein